jgi:hypothetical protein
MDFVSTEVDLSLGLAYAANTDRQLGYNQTAERGFAIAWRG